MLFLLLISILFTANIQSMHMLMWDLDSIRRLHWCCLALPMCMNTQKASAAHAVNNNCDCTRPGFIDLSTLIKAGEGRGKVDLPQH